MGMIMNLPCGRHFDIDRVPENLEELVQSDFHNFTAGTSEEYTFEDKLYYIDQMTEKLHHAADPSVIVNRLITDMFNYDLEEHRHLMDPDELLESGFFETCVEAGQKSMTLYSHDFGRSRHDSEKIMKIMIRVITAVLLWEPDSRNSQQRD